ncbi:MFS transporter [Lactobacillus sp.]|uniref:MFS transporter n=1 Tax=Lactobacillus sp. TaxID=1591 RepID=UPI0019C6187F|nr:MFS transporter [Lactobacillus sp.]MBD5430266.1 MFS transporter [Lactobacillus sp.]
MSNKKIKIALFALSVTFFAVGVTEFISVGVLPSVAHEFHISTSTAGLITTIYALGVALGAPILTLVTVNLVKKRVISGGLIIFVIGHLLITFAPNFNTILIGRFIAGSAHGLLFALSSTIAAELVGESKQASAIAFIFSGFTIATAIGAPLGTSVSVYFGWRIPFFIIAILGFIAFILNTMILPITQPSFKKINLLSQLKLVIHPHIILTLLITILGYGGTFAAFTYLSPILEKITHIQVNYISFILVIYGIAIAVGNSLGGKLGNNNPIKILLIIFIIQAIALFTFFFTETNATLAIINIIVLGLVAFMSVPVLQSYVLSLAKSYQPDAVEIASSLNISSFSFGIVLGSFIGGKVISNIDLAHTTIAAGILVTLAILLIYFEIKMENRRINIKL